MSGQATLTSRSLPAPALDLVAVNKTLQTLYKGNIVELDYSQSSSLSIPTATENTTYGLDGAAKGATNAVLTTAAGLTTYNNPHGVVIQDYLGPRIGVLPGSNFPVAVDGIAPICINPNQSQILTVSATSGSLVFNVTLNGTATANQTYTYSQTASTAVSNLQNALGSLAASIGNTNVSVGNTGTTGFTFTFSGNVTNPGPLNIVTNGLAGGGSFGHGGGQHQPDHRRHSADSCGRGDLRGPGGVALDAAGVERCGCPHELYAGCD